MLGTSGKYHFSVLEQSTGRLHVVAFCRVPYQDGIMLGVLI